MDLVLIALRVHATLSGSCSYLYNPLLLLAQENLKGEFAYTLWVFECPKNEPRLTIYALEKTDS